MGNRSQTVDQSLRDVSLAEIGPMHDLVTRALNLDGSIRDQQAYSEMIALVGQGQTA